MSEDDDDPTPRAREALWQRVVVGLFAAVIWIVGALPNRLVYAIADLLAVPWFLWWCVRDRRGRRSSGYWRNCRIAFRPGAPLGAERPRRHLWRWSRHIAWLAIDFCRMHRITAANAHEHCDLREYPRVAEAFGEGKGLIFATGHIGVWDVAGHVAGLLGLPLTSVFRPSPLPALNRLIERLRTGTGSTVVARKNVMWTLKKVLGEHRAIGILADGGGKHSSVVAPFLGVPARTVATPALLHVMLGAPIAVVVMLRTGRMRFRLRVLDVIRDAATGDRERDLIAITGRINAALTQAVAEAPEQWFWQSRRFRHRPAGEQPGADGLPPLAVDRTRMAATRP
ncbi:MAG: lysophospholipid acyltransferase family protein [Planctomycetes bacterium]|nr:lysophospholipid acyltransferase family protein [Planctomycetota bacterium]